MAVRKFLKWKMPSYGEISLLPVAEKILPLCAAVLIAFALAWLLAAAFGHSFAFVNYGPTSEGITGKGDYSVTLPVSAVKEPSLADFVNSNPFNVLVRHEKAVIAGESDTAKNNLFSLDGMTLSGTMPGIGVQLDDGDKAPFILKGDNYRGYTLKAIDSDKAVFVKGKGEYLLYLLYGKADTGRHPSREEHRPQPVKTPVRDAKDAAGTYNGAIHDGIIARELVNDLLMNPFNEMKKVRLRAKFENGSPLGIEVQWLAKDSLLGELGVKKGDVVQSINSVPISNMGDISNAINSLMGGDRFEVEVLREGEKVPLTYAVK